ncbi:guanine nucleotide-releasing factor 2 [Ctenocephalides felis]|uniref:guanine nucleotide-releasing factor 2 n=1 Tax=Ctenocephalides felis TaxID=7515 RepID=UPI000E6E2290|nr:guanine nucleotide-releasing factor 2 [Ctenocephalides felis]
MMSVTPRNEKYNNPEYESPLSSGGTGSLRSNKLARRARSFKEDFLGRINQMRSPNNTIIRSQSPHQHQTMDEAGTAVTSPLQQNGTPFNNNFKRGLVNPGFCLIGGTNASAGVSKEVERLLRELSFALRHFRDVVTKNTLVMLPGNGTVLLDTVAAIQSALVGNEPVISTYGAGGSTGALAAACGAVRHALSGLIELCDEVLLRGAPALDGRDVQRDVTALEEAIQNLVQLAQEKMLKQQQANANNRNSKHGTGMSPLNNRSSIESQRTSLPDIPLTPRELEILHRNSSSVTGSGSIIAPSSPNTVVTPRRSAEATVKSPRSVRAARSTESLLRVDVDDGGGGLPPPKPPLPNRGCGLAIASVASAAAVESLLLLQQDQTPPPLPPKKKQQQKSSASVTCCDDQDNNCITNALDRVSISSPEDCASLLSGSGSLDSALNQSREEEELAALMRSDSPTDVNVIASDVDRCLSGGDRFHPGDDLCHTDGCHRSDKCLVGESDRCLLGDGRCHEESDIGEAHGNDDSGNNCWDEANLNTSVPSDTHRHSNESGFASMQSLRSSCQSFTKRSSQQSYTGFTSSNGISQNHSTRTISDNMVQTSSSSFFTKEATSSSSYNSVTSHDNDVMKMNINMMANAFSNMMNSNNLEGFNKSTSEASQVVSRRSGKEKTGMNVQSSFEQFSNEKKTVVTKSVVKSGQLVQTDEFNMSSDVCDNFSTVGDDNLPPVLPEKTIKSRQKRERHHSTYDNLLDEDEYQNNESLLSNLSSSEETFERRPKEHSSLDSAEPPPLPLKKKHIMAYMEMFGNCSRPGGAGMTMSACTTSSSACSAQYIIGGGGVGEFTRHSVHACAAQEQWSTGAGFVTSRQGHHMAHSATMSLSPYRHSQPPPSRHLSTLPAATEIEISTCSTPKNSISSISPQSSTNLAPPSPKASNTSTTSNSSQTTSVTPPALPPKRRSKASSTCSADSVPPASPTVKQSLLQQQNELERSIYGQQEQRYSDASDMPESDRDSVFLRNSDSDLIIPDDVPCQNQQIIPQEPIVNPLDELDVSNWILLKKEDEEGPDIRGGHPDALIVLATKAKNELLYQEAFLTTYRTFITPQALVQKLCYRHQRLVCQPDTARQRAAKEAFSMLVRIVSELTPGDLDSTLEPLREFCYQLIASGHLTMAKVLRSKLIEKYELKQNLQTPYTTLSAQSVFTSQASLTDFKSEHLAEQMTLLDAELYTKIEIPEVLLWAREQCEERSPNLTRFTEHFNKMSYWARSRILDKPEARDRERYVVKFLKIMKHLRKMNNFNSYLALLSALDSAPITRLEWPKQTTEMLKEFCALIDSRSSFRAYRQALAESQPPCIPYIGLVLQDLTFIHIGNSDLLPDGGINFTKRWQQYHIVNNMKRFKTGSYGFKKNERIIAYFSNFDDYLNEEAMWQISESIKPRGGRKNVQ